MKNRIALAVVMPVVLATVACGGGGQTPNSPPAAQAPVAPPAHVTTAHAPVTPKTVHTATASTPHTVLAASAHAPACQDCATVQDVQAIKRKGEGGAVGMIGGAVVGGLLGHQVGGGKGKTLATVGGAAAGAFAGNEVQKQVSAKTVWVTTVKMKDGSTRTFEQEAQPAWKAGQSVHVKEGALSPV